MYSPMFISWAINEKRVNNRLSLNCFCVKPPPINNVEDTSVGGQ